ncbi:MAG TPA: HEAT repeat domain-containing protein [Bacteroidota bacterium]|nr:HEAT repeat domain-containing protein [Bacteroidota bacterium]
MTMHEHIRNELAAFLSGDLDERTAAAVRDHLGACEECGRELESLKNMWQSLAKVPDEVPSERLGARFYDALNAYENSLRGSGLTTAGRFRGADNRVPDRPGMLEWIGRLGWPGRLGSLISRQPAIQFALVLTVLMVGGFIGYGLRSNGARNEEMVQLREEVRSVSRLLIVSLLQQQTATGRLQGVSWSYRVDNSDPEITGALLQTLSQDPNVNVRLAALDALSRNLGQPAVRGGLIKALEKQSSPLIQLAIVDMVVQSDMKESGDVLRQILQKPGVNETVKKRIEEALQHLTT